MIKFDARFIYVVLRWCGRLLGGSDRIGFKKGIEVDHLNKRSKDALAAERIHKQVKRARII